MKHIFVSPHFDDVALSCGGQIIANPARSEDVLVLNIFTSEPADAVEGGSKTLALFDSLNSGRTLEDKAAWDEIGVRCLHANLPEALLRGKFPFRLLDNPRDEGVIEDVYNLLSELAVSHPQARFYFPAGIGNHVDHLACQRAAFRLLDDERLDGITLYEDIPYCWLSFVRSQYYRRFCRTVDLGKDGRAEAMRPTGVSLWKYLFGKDVPFPRGKKLFPAVYAALLLGNVAKRWEKPAGIYRGKVKSISLDDAQMEKKKALIYRYQSQIPMLFGNAPDQLLRDLRQSFSKEVSIEITSRP